MQELLLQSHRGEDSAWMVNYKNCPHFLFPISILVGGNYDLLCNTPNTNGALWKDVSVTHSQPPSVTPKYWSCKSFQLRKAAETSWAKPPQVRAMAWEELGHARCWCEAVWSWWEVPQQAYGGGLWVPIARWDGTDSEHRVWKSC